MLRGIVPNSSRSSSPESPVIEYVRGSGLGNITLFTNMSSSKVIDSNV